VSTCPLMLVHLDWKYIMSVLPLPVWTLLVLPRCRVFLWRPVLLRSCLQAATWMPLFPWPSVACHVIRRSTNSLCAFTIRLKISILGSSCSHGALSAARLLLLHWSCCGKSKPSRDRRQQRVVRQPMAGCRRKEPTALDAWILTLSVCRLLWCLMAVWFASFVTQLPRSFNVPAVPCRHSVAHASTHRQHFCLPHLATMVEQSQ